MGSLKGVDHTYGYADNDLGVVMVQFKVGADEIASLMYLYNELQRNMDRLPPGTQPPLVKSMGISDVPILAVTLSSQTFTETRLRQIAVRFLDQLHTVPNTGVSHIIGVEPEAIRIMVDPQRLAGNGLSLNQLLDVLEGSNVVMPGGRLEADNRQIPIRIDGALGSLDDLGGIVIGARQGRPILLKEVATIENGPSDEQVHVWMAYGRGQADKPVGEPVNAVTIAVGKRPGKNSVTTARALQAKLETLRREALPEGVQMTITRNYGHQADEAVNTLDRAPRRGADRSVRYPALFSRLA